MGTDRDKVVARRDKKLARQRNPRRAEETIPGAWPIARATSQATCRARIPVIDKSRTRRAPIIRSAAKARATHSARKNPAPHTITRNPHAPTRRAIQKSRGKIRYNWINIEKYHHAALRYMKFI